MHLGNRKQTTGLARRFEQLDAAIAGVRDPRGRDGCTSDEGKHGDACNKSKCGWCGWKGHNCQECRLEVDLCHHCHQLDHFRENLPRLVGGELRFHRRYFSMKWDSGFL